MMWENNEQARIHASWKNWQRDGNVNAHMRRVLHKEPERPDWALIAWLSGLGIVAIVALTLAVAL